MTTMGMLTKKRFTLLAASVIIVLLAGGGLWWWRSTRPQPKLVYTPEGYGGFVPARPKAAGKSKKPADPLQPAVTAYNAGRYKDAEAAALRVIESAAKSKDPIERKQAAKAHYVLAFSAAPRKDLQLARDRFAVLQQEAAKLPDKGKQGNMPGVVSPTLEEEGAYQHAVCTAALGDKEAAEAEYMKFMRDYPESPLIHGAVQRIERLHNGHLPPEAEAAWNRAVKTAQAREKARERERSLCGPECLAELLRRKGKKANIHALAREMKTNENGTSLQALADAAKKHGFSAKGLALTQKGLSKQPLPLAALVAPGHYVLVDAVTPKEVTVWDANGKGQGKPDTKRYTVQQWGQIWSGVALILRPK
jgi:predicted double-glycine peptidase